MNVEEPVRAEFRMQVPWLLGFDIHIWAIQESTLVEDPTGKTANIGVHAVLDTKNHKRIDYQ